MKFSEIIEKNDLKYIGETDLYFIFYTKFGKRIWMVPRFKQDLKTFIRQDFNEDTISTLINVKYINDDDFIEDLRMNPLKEENRIIIDFLESEMGFDIINTKKFVYNLWDLDEDVFSQIESDCYDIKEELESEDLFWDYNFIVDNNDRVSLIINTNIHNWRNLAYERGVGNFLLSTLNSLNI